MDKVVAVRSGDRIPPVVIVTKKESGSCFVRGLLGDRSVYVSYEADGHCHIHDPKAPLTWEDEERVRIARLDGYADPERQPVEALHGDEHIATFLGRDTGQKTLAKHLRDPFVIDIPDWRPAGRVSVAIYLSETGHVGAAIGEQRVIMEGKPHIVAVASSN